MTPSLPRVVAHCALVAALLLALPAARGAHPLQTEDTATQGQGVVEIEHGLGVVHEGPTRVVAYAPHVAVGLTPALDVIVQPSWVWRRAAGDPSARGWGDTHVDLKWRFASAAPWSFATRVGVGLPTSQHGLGQPHGALSPHALLVASHSAAPWALHANAVFAHVPAGGTDRENLFGFAAAALWTVHAHWTLAIEATGTRNADRAGPAFTGTTLAALIYTMRPGFDLDVGYQRALGPRPAARTWLLGMTYHFTR